VSRILAVDWGVRRLGLARSDDLGLTAQPLPPVILPAFAGNPGDAARRAARAAADAIVEAVAAHGIERVVLGLPLELSGRSGEAADRVTALVAALAPRLGSGVPVETWDERLTSAQAERSLREEGWSAGSRRGGGRERTRASQEDKARIDQRAALLLLQSWLDAHPGGGRHGGGEDA
jgi:putative Holliday junction resolvase